MGCCGGCLDRICDIFEMRFLQPHDCAYTRIPEKSIQSSYNHHKDMVNIKKQGQFSSLNRKDFSDKYTVLPMTLGQGSFCKVKLGENKSTGDRVALKIFDKANLKNEFDIERLSAEINILSTVDHTRIIRLYDVYDTSQYVLVALEYVPGGELFERIVKREYYTEHYARSLIREVLEALAYLHDKAQVVHRDLKPENLLMMSERDDTGIKLVDFGFASRVEDLKDNEMVMGTPAYVAPEILRGDRYCTEVDIWSFGVICYIMLCGVPPFMDDDTSVLFEKIKEGIVNFQEEHWTDLSVDAIEFVACMIQVDQKQRLTASQLLQHKWMTTGSQPSAKKHMRNSQTNLKRNSSMLKRMPALEFPVGNRRRSICTEKPSAEVLASYRKGQTGRNRAITYYL